MKKFIFLLFFFYQLSAQNNSLFEKAGQKKNINNKIEEKKIENPDFSWKPSPIKAAIYSTIFPGLGQLYNKRYWKAPLMLGAITGGIFFTLYQRNIYQRHHLNHINAVNGTQIDNPNQLSINQLYQIKSNAQRYYNYVFLFTIIGYVINIMDGFVDAHLYEIRKDKQLSLIPSVIPSFNQNENFAFGMTLNFRF